MVRPMFARRVNIRPGLQAREGGSTSAPDKFWTMSPEALLQHWSSSANGLSTTEAEARLRRYGSNTLQTGRDLSHLRVLFNQVKSPLLLLLVFGAVISAVSGEWIDAAIVLIILIVSIGIGYQREYSAQRSAAALRARLLNRADVLRDGQKTWLLVAQIVPGDVLLLSAGSLVPADAIVLEASDCHVSEAALTGESFPVQKEPGICAPTAPLRERSNSVFLGTNVRSGTARCLVVATGESTQYGGIAKRLKLRPPETEFERGIRHFGYLLTSAMLVLVLVVFAAHVVQGRPAIETLLFSIALAVGLSPELLPVILSVSLARGAELMAAHGVLVRRLSAIENLGSMDVLCTDKTGTLTEGVVRLEAACDPQGQPSRAVLELAAENAAFETGLPSPLDDAIIAACSDQPHDVQKLAEIPFDFVRKRVSVIVRNPRGVRLVMKGAWNQVLAVCDKLPGSVPLTAEAHELLQAQYEQLSGEGARILAIATRSLPAQAKYDRSLEIGLTFEGFLTFSDRPKAGAKEAIAALARLGINVKLITGDNRLVARKVAGLVGLRTQRVLTGADLDELHDEALWREAERTDLFVEVDPNQKERIILALKKLGHVVGFLGDGVNDAPAMHAADTSISVEQAADVAREAADFVLLARDLDVIRRGVEAGRKTFANTLKYILTTTSANLGNMLSMAAASLFLPFLPLLAGQILLNNFLSDVPAMGIVDDNVDEELLVRPRRWDMRYLARFMVSFGLLSSLFDFLTFAALIGLFHASPELFRTGWFVASLLTELVIALVVRTPRSAFRSRPGKTLLISTLILIPVAFAIPFLPLADAFGFVPLPWSVMGAIAAITAMYVATTELAKRALS
jgi:P-type Mg2+ transporter